MVRFAHLREAFLFEVYRETFARNGEFRFQQMYDPMPSAGLAPGLLHKCLLGLINSGYMEFRQDVSGAHDGYEITAAGIEYVESQFEPQVDRPHAGTDLARALAHLTGDEAVANAHPGTPDEIESQVQDAVAAVVGAVVAELGEAARNSPGGPHAAAPLSRAALQARAKLLVAPRAPAELLDGLISTALTRLAEMGVVAEIPKESEPASSTQSLIQSVTVPNAQASGP
ncbi:MAG: hypothetical protein O7A03_01880 [Alphaproteobacteria bacterium]|nr:hypothetical protein [Alphaproteobacteria bacterium]